MDAELTPEQQELLAQCEADFVDRYTESDPDYAKVLTPSEPPIVHPWYNHARRNYDWGGGPRRDHGGRDRGQDGGRDRWKDRHNRRDDRHYNRHQPYHRNR